MRIERSCSKPCRARFSRVARRAGSHAGIGACLTDDANDLTSVLRQPDADAIIGALGCARLMRFKLPVPEIGELMASPNKLLALAAERYLDSEDSLAARTMLLARFPAETRILGARYAFVPKPKVDAAVILPHLDVSSDALRASGGIQHKRRSTSDRNPIRSDASRSLRRALGAGRR